MHKQHKNIFLSRSLFVATKKNDIRQDYDIKEELGKGAFGSVYLGVKKDQTYKRRAIKQIQKCKVKFPVTLLNQMEVLKKLDHPNIIKIYESYEDEENFYLVTDLCEGGEVYQRLETMGSLSETEAREIFKQILYAVNYCHSMNIAHRDLKPDNFLLLDPDTLSIKLIDFGLAFEWKEDMKIQMKAKKQDRIVGTPYYVAPEMIKGIYDERCDIWSLGVILYIILTGVPPFDGQNDRQILDQVSFGEYSFDIPQMKSVSDEAKDLISKILVPDHKRLTIEQIYKHPWMQMEVAKNSLKLNYGKMKNFSSFSKLKTFAATYIASHLSGKQIQKLSKLFREIDANHDGFITSKELSAALSNQKQQTNILEIQSLIDSIDTDQNGKINYTEFLTCCMDNSVLFREQNLMAAFRALDTDGNGVVSTEELKASLLKDSKHMLEDSEIDEILKKSDSNNDGVIDFQEFVACISGLS